MGAWFDTIIEILQNPFFLLLAVVFAIIVLFAVLKKLVKLAIIVVAVFIIYIAYLVWTGQDVADSIEDIQKTFETGKGKVDEAAGELKDRAARSADSTIQEQVEKILGDDEKSDESGGD
jgi:membrane protein implicated in regulation of membrane protease activity